MEARRTETTPAAGVSEDRNPLEECLNLTPRSKAHVDSASLVDVSAEAGHRGGTELQPPSEKKPNTDYVARQRGIHQRQNSSSPISSPCNRGKQQTQQSFAPFSIAHEGAASDVGEPSAEVEAQGAAANTSLDEAAAVVSQGGSSSGSSELTGLESLTPILGPIDCNLCEVVIETCPEFTVPRLCIRGRKVERIEDSDLEKLCAALDAAFALERPMTILWDVRSVSLPSRRQINLGLEWIAANSHLLDMYLQGIAVILSSFLVRGILNFVLALTQPPQPNGCFADDQEAFAFARDKCTEVKVWVGQSKLKKKLAAAEKAGRLPSARGLPENALPVTPRTSEADASKVQPAADPGDAATAPASAPHAPTTDAVPPAAAPPEAVPPEAAPPAAAPQSDDGELASPSKTGSPRSSMLRGSSGRRLFKMI